jgi:hypothetical protein
MVMARVMSSGLPVRSVPGASDIFESSSAGRYRAIPHMNNPTLMRVHIQNRATLLYYAGAGVWTHGIDSAFNFGSVVLAMDRALHDHLSGVDVLMHFENSRFDIRLPLSP